MKKSLKIAFISLTSLVLTIGSSISIPFSIDSYKSNISEEKLINNNELKYIDYFKNKPIFNENESQNIKSIITKIINKYRLYEWNNYFKNSKNKLTKSNVLEPSFNDYKESFNNNIKTNSLFKGTNIEYTKIYLDQDEQFRFFNDFINIINEEDNKNQEDFLYLRWQYYAYQAAEKYHNLKYKNKPIYDVNLSDWVSAISTLISSWGSNFYDLQDLITVMFEYYGFNISFKDNVIDFKNSDFSLIKPNITHALLCSKDMVMRISSVNDYDIKKYSLFEQKAKRIIEINKDMNNYYSLLIDSLTGTIDQGSLDEDVDKADVEGVLENIKDIVSQVLDMVVGYAKLNLNEYANVSQIDKYGSINVKDIIRKN